MTRIEIIKQLCDHVWEILTEEAGNDDELITQACDRNIKDTAIVRLRERVLLRLRSEVWEYGYAGNRKWKVLRSTNPPPGENWNPISYPHIAFILGGHHTAWLKRHQELSRKPPLAIAKVS